MKLYDVPRNSRIKVMEEGKVPPVAPTINEGEELNFRSIDGMYSYCTRDNGDVVHLVAWAEVKIIDPIEPATVLLGLIFVNFGPLNNFPKINPPISEATHPNNREISIIFKCKKLEKTKNIIQKLNI